MCRDYLIEVLSAIGNREILPGKTWDIGSRDGEVICIPAGCKTEGFEKIASFSIESLLEGLTPKQWDKLLVKLINHFEKEI